MIRSRLGGRALLGRADAAPRIGQGHVARLGALLEAWCEAGGRALLYGAGVSGSLRQRLLQAGVELLDREPADALLTPGPPETVPEAGPDDLQTTLELAASCDAVAVAADGYAFRRQWLGGLRRQLPSLAIDDLAAWPPVSHVLVNQNIDFEPSRYGSPLLRQEAPDEEPQLELDTPLGPVRLLVGHPYILLRRELRQAAVGLAPHKGEGDAAPAAPGHRPPVVLLAFGGSDPAGLTVPAGKALLEQLPAGTQLQVVLGGAIEPARRRAVEQELTVCAARLGRAASLLVLQDVQRMARVLEGATLAVLGAGATTWEALALGVPPLVVAVADNQRAVTDGLTRRGAGLELGPLDEALPQRLARRVGELLADAPRRAELAARGRRLVDGDGVWRVIEALLDVVERRQEVQP